MGSVQVLKRKSELSESFEMRGKIQISFNNWGHLCIRSIGEKAIGEENNLSNIQYDQLIVLDAEATRELASFMHILENKWRIKS